MKKFSFRLLIFFILCAHLFAAENKQSDSSILKAEAFQGLKLRGIGPAVASGRISDIVVHPENRAIYYVAASSGGVWKTVNAGTTWTPVFDEQGSYSIGCLAVDAGNPLIIWVGTGENNSQRSVSYGDGVYKSIDGGKTWENMGLKKSEHIGKIIVDPRNSSIVYVAAQGPLWASGGDRGVYKTKDGGKTWEHVLKISEDTGANEVMFDPRNPDILYASTYQRRRHVWTMINGGPESAIYKSTDAGETWKKLENGLPKEHMGKIGLAVSPVKPDVVYAIIESIGKDNGFYRSIDAGANWEKMSDYVASAPMYYNEIFADPKNVDRVYSMDFFNMVTHDGGKTFQRLGESSKHVDNHALWIDPDDTNYLLNGCDGGVYESFDRGATWNYKSNLPITQFYRVNVDNSKPFYYVYGGTQDNNTMGGPSRTTTAHGIINSDWFVTVGGDGFWIAVDPEDPNIVYSESQYGGLMRFDRRTGEKVDIQPQPEKGEALRFNWDSPLILSPHSRTRLYFAANKLFRSDDRGDNWTAVSADLTRQIDRNKLKVMGRVWSIDSVAKSANTSFYGNIVSLAESPLQEGLLYVGTDDGLIQISEDGGQNWRKVERFSGIPELTYVSQLRASPHDASTIFAAFNNHKMGDFRPYLLKSTDRGRSWNSIAGNLPERGSIYAVVQDHVDPNLLFAGTEFGLFFTSDGGKKWIRLKGGIPTIAVKDLAIQMRENDLVLATFGRGFYILDDYSALRRLTEKTLQQETQLFPVRTAWMFIPEMPLSLPDKAFMGDNFYSAPNPPFGAVFTYYLKEELKSKKKARRDNEKEAFKEGKDVFYPSWEQLEAEDREEEPAIVLTVTDEEGNVVRRITGPATAGFHRVAWDLRFPPADPAKINPPPPAHHWVPLPVGPMAVPGNFSVTLAKRIDGKLIPLGEPQSFTASSFATPDLSAEERPKLLEFQKRIARLQRAVFGSVEAASEAQKRLEHLRKAFDDTPGADPKWREDTNALLLRLNALQKKLSGDTARRSRNEPAPPGIVDRIQGIISGHWTTSTGQATGTHRKNYEIAAEEFEEVLKDLRALVETDLRNLEAKAEQAGAPWTPGRLPTWSREH